MKRILVVAQKGGVGKSFIADEIAFSFERSGIPIAFIDLDQQGGTLHKTSKTQGSEVVIVDTPGALQDKLVTWIQNADLIIVPTRPSSRDIPPFNRIMEAVTKNIQRDAVALYVVNQFTRYNVSRDFLTYLQMKKERGEPPFSKDHKPLCLMISQSEMVLQAGALGKSVVDYAPNSTVAGEVLKLCNLCKRFFGYKGEE